MANELDANTVKVIERLKASGWRRTGSGDALDWANLLYETADARLQIDYLPDDTSLSLVCLRPDGEFELLVEFGDRLDGFLDLLIEMQEDLGPDTWDTFVERLVARTPRVFAVLGDDEEDVVPLTPSEDQS